MAFYLCISHGTFLTCLNSIERDQSLLSLSVANVRERHTLSFARACTFYLSKRKAGSSSSTLFRNKLTRFLSMSSMCLSLPPHPSTANPPTDETKHKITPKEREKRRGPHLDNFHQQNCFVFLPLCVSFFLCSNLGIVWPVARPSWNLRVLQESQNCNHFGAVLPVRPFALRDAVRDGDTHRAVDRSDPLLLLLAHPHT